MLREQTWDERINLKVLVKITHQEIKKLGQVREERDKLSNFRSQIIWAILGDVKKSHNVVTNEEIFRVLDNIKKSGRED